MDPEFLRRLFYNLNNHSTFQTWKFKHVQQTVLAAGVKHTFVYTVLLCI